MSTRDVLVEAAVRRAADRYSLTITDNTKPALEFLASHGIDTKNDYLQLANVAMVVHRGCEALTEGSIPDCPLDVRESQFNLDFREHLRLLSAALTSEAEAREVATHALVSGIIATLYATCKPETYDLFSHLRVSEMMFIDGDSLLIDAMSRPSVDQDHIQTLHVAFIVVTLLQDLMQRGANVYVLFFDSGEWLWSAAPQKRLARNVVRDMLLARAEQDNCPFGCVRLASFWGKACAEYLDLHRPEVFALTDGETLEPPTADMAKYGQPFRSILGDSAVGAQAAEYFHAMMLWSVVRRVHAVFMPFDRPHNNDTVAFTVRASGSRVALYERSVSDAIALIRQRIAAHPLNDTPEATVASVDESVSDAAAANGRSNRERATALAAAVALANPATYLATPVDVALLKLVFIAAFAAHHVGPEERAQPMSPSPPLASFLSAFAPLLGACIANYAPGGRDWDLLDSHFVAAMGRALASAPLASVATPELCARIDTAWSAIGGTSPLSTTVIADLPVFPVPPQPASVGTVLTPVHPMIEQLAADFGMPPTPHVEPTVGYGLASNLGGWEVFNALDKFDSVVDVDHEAAEKEKCENDRKLQVRKDKAEARYVHEVQSTAASCGIVSFLFRNEEQCIVDDRADRQRKRGDKSSAATNAAKTSRSGANMKLDNFIRLCKLGLMQQYTRFRTNVEKGVTLLKNRNATEKERREVIDNIMKFADNLRISEAGGDGGDDSSDSDTDAAPIDDAVKVWRAFAKRSGEQAISDEKSFVMRHTGSGNDMTFQTIAELEQFAKESDVLHDRNERIQHQINLLDTKLKKKSKKSADVVEREVAELEGLRVEQEALQQQIVLRVSGDAARRFVNMIFFRYFEAHGKLAVYIQVVKCLCALWKAVKEDAKRLGVAPSLTYATELFQAVHKTYSLVESTRIRMTREDRDVLRSALRHLDFPTSYCSLVDSYDAQWEDIPPLNPLKAEDLPRYLILNLSAISFQLQHMGHLLERPVIQKRDPRVPFNPDKWQRDLLDVVDRRGSAIVCAPTSAGKTFISYYCMKKVLRESNKDVIVYIAPTRALINQAVADVYARFGKKQYRNANCSVYGVLGGADFVRTPFTCQALVTLPEVFETILLSPVHQEWLKNVKYVIFDEIHSLESSGNGAVWERLLAMVRAPFVALSATLGDHQQLCAWLNRVQSRMQLRFPNDDRSYGVTYIPNDGSKIQRWSDIQKYVYLPEEGCDPILQVHPMTCVTLEMLQSRFPQDLPFVPSECLQLYAQMSRLSLGYRTESYSDVDAMQSIDEALRRLDPEVMFASDRYITQDRARQWEQALKDELVRWGKLSTPGGYAALGFTLHPLNEEEVERFTADMRTLVEALLNSYTAESAQREAVIAQRAEEEKGTHPDSLEYVLDNILPALRGLQERGLGPTLVFAFEERDCYAIVERLVETLERQEARFRETPEFQRYVAEMAAKKEEYERLKMRKEKGLDDGKKRVVGEDGSVQVQERSVDVEVDDSQSYDIPDVLPQFSFASSIAVERSTFLSMTERLNETDIEYRALQRGIGIHHGGIRGKFRNAVERLFRMRYLPIVVATETLALGIHSPCRSVVLAGDHMLLNTTQFRQMSGRAGRRGLDFLGHVVFLGVPLQKIQRLLTSNLMVLRGHIMSDTVVQLRLLQLYNSAAVSSDAKSKKVSEWAESIQPYVECMCTDPLFYLGRLRTSMEPLQVTLMRKIYVYFLQQGFTFAEKASMLGSLVTYVLNVFYNADAKAGALTLVSLFARNDLPTEADALLGVLAYCLSRNVNLDCELAVHRSLLRDPARHKKYNVALPPWSTLLPSGGKSLREMHVQCMTIVSSALQDFARSMDREVPTLPLQLVNAAGTPIAVLPTSSDTEPALAAALKKTAVPYTSRSLYSALSGKGDFFEGVDDAIWNVREGVFMDPSWLPMIDFEDGRRHDGAQRLTNACLRDFVANGDVQVNGKFRRVGLERNNGLNATVSWYSLNKAFKALQNFARAINVVKPTGGNAVAKSLAEVAQRVSELDYVLNNHQPKVVHAEK